jgi:hypothetical protein
MFAGTGTTGCFGPAHNPWNLDHQAGGSSSGSAAATAAKSILGAADLFGVEVPASIRKVAALLNPNEKTSRYFEFSDIDQAFGFTEKEEKTASESVITVDGLVMPITNPTELNLSEEWFGRKSSKKG